MNNIILIGMRGSGKTTVGKALSLKMNRQFVDIDELIVQKIGMEIPDVIAKFGWDYFREKESETVREVGERRGLIISTGGGVIENSKNAARLRENGLLIYLQANLKTLDRVKGDKNRPPIIDGNEIQDIEAIFARRKNLYEDYADLIIAVDNLRVDQVVDKISQSISQIYRLSN